MTGSELKKLRQSTGLTQEKFAVLVLGVTTMTVCRWELGQTRIDDLRAGGIREKVTEHLARRQKKT